MVTSTPSAPVAAPSITAHLHAGATTAIMPPPPPTPVPTPLPRTADPAPFRPWEFGSAPDHAGATPHPTHWYAVQHNGERYHYGVMPNGVISAGPSALLGRQHGYHGQYAGAPQVSWLGPDRPAASPSLLGPPHPTYQESSDPHGLTDQAIAAHHDRAQDDTANQRFLAGHQQAFHLATNQAKDATSRAPGIIARLQQHAGHDVQIPAHAYDDAADMARVLSLLRDLPDHQRRLLHAAGIRIHATSGNPYRPEGGYRADPTRRPWGVYLRGAGHVNVATPPDGKAGLEDILHHELGHALSHAAGHLLGAPTDEWGLRNASNLPAWRALHAQYQDHPAFWNYLRDSPEEFYAGAHAALHAPPYNRPQGYLLSRDQLAQVAPDVHAYMTDHDALLRRIVHDHTAG